MIFEVMEKLGFPVLSIRSCLFHLFMATTRPIGQLTRGVKKMNMGSSGMKEGNSWKMCEGESVTEV